VLNRLRGRLAARRHAGVARGATGAADMADFLEIARRSFVCVQQAWDRADLTALSHLATGPLLEELRSQLAERGPGPNHTEVVRIEARLLAVETLREAQLASVEFSGLIREEIGAHARPFRELWMLARLQGTEPGWRVARVQALS
jgi:predicted lipid-binding transport protein (Tim44 family)